MIDGERSVNVKVLRRLRFLLQAHLYLMQFMKSDLQILRIRSELDYRVFLFKKKNMSRVLFENRPALYFCNYKENKKNCYTYVGYYKLMILYSLWSNIFIIRIVVIIIGNKKKLNSIFDTESKIIQFMGRNKYIITKIKFWPVFKQDPMSLFIVFLLIGLFSLCGRTIRPMSMTWTQPVSPPPPVTSLTNWSLRRSTPPGADRPRSAS